MKNIIIDCDPGHDDIMAIITSLAHKDKLNILGITTVAGNQTLDKVTNNILKVEEYLNINIPVYKGCDKPLIRESAPQPIAHGESGMDGPILEDAKRSYEDKDALTFLKETLSIHNDIYLIGLAPLTNIALLIKNYPELIKNIKEIIIMGGAIEEGNITPYAEFNIWHDPEAADIIFSSNIKVIVAPLEVCYKGSILLKEINIFDKKKKVSSLIYDLLDFYFNYARKRNWDKTAIFDLVPIIYLLEPDLFNYYNANIKIEIENEDHIGQMIINKDDKGKHKILFDTNREEFMNIFFEAIKYLDDKYERENNE